MAIERLAVLGSSVNRRLVARIALRGKDLRWQRDLSLVVWETVGRRIHLRTGTERRRKKDDVLNKCCKVATHCTLVLIVSN